MSTYLTVRKAFETTINRGAFSSRSSELKTLVAAVDAFIGRMDKQTIAAVRDAFYRWRDRNPKEYADRGAPIEGDLKTELRDMLRHFAVPMLPPGVAEEDEAEASGPSMSLKEVTAWIQPLRARLEAFAGYACGDLLHGQPKGVTYDPVKGPDWNQGFAALAQPGKRAEIFARYNDKVRYPGSTSIMITPMLIGRDWKPMVCSGFHSAVTGGKRGVCTSFGQAAAHVLTAGLKHGPRVELVSWGGSSVGHVFVLVNRAGGYMGNRIPDSWVHEPAVVVVDTWLGSLGHGVISIGPANYRSSMRTGLTCTGEKAPW
jgi:hypothetical protein